MTDTNSPTPEMEFHISRQARDRYQFDDSLFNLHGNVIFANMHAVRMFTNKINQKRDLVSFPEQAVRAGQLYAMGLIDEILHFVTQLYREQIDPLVFVQALEWLQDKIGVEEVDKVLQHFADEFPPVSLYRREIDLQAYLNATTASVPNRVILLEELAMLFMANANPAFAPYLEFFNDAALRKDTAYMDVTASLNDFFQTKPLFGPDNQSLLNMLRSPAVKVPHSLFGQLEYIREKWGYLLGKHIYRLLSSLDLIREEEKAIFGDAGPALVYDYSRLEEEPERFSQDKDWMPRVVIIAKNIYVWLNQLSKKYQRTIAHLDHIPDEELDTLQRWGITGLWLIGLWERSRASRRIKNLMGNPEAVASAYSLFDYQIAEDLGGEQAYETLRARAWQRGIRLASDMVPNHMGIDSRWLVEHPDWFIGLNYSPFPSYTFNGEDLSWDERVGIYLEDHYYERSDAAVVFKRRDHFTGSEVYIYHGNDGTSMPWNDTAQLDFLNPEVREAVVQTILHVARKFSIIRFDAAMTLAKKHYQRLWYPEPGTGGAIPSRAEFGLTKAAFDRRMPVEFWREVVDRVAAEIPDTLLLAEAFWLMEGYFVRTLGMHRVYNSAFMNMLRDEENANYRSVMKNTLEFDPEILKRFVNFMNNPDERTALDQFGRDDKYFGICTMMATLPGLPMFGHGQIEGYAEKYGMEYRQAYWDEKPDPHLIARHEREIFPWLHRRYLFAEVENFLFYDFFTTDGTVNEDVFVYSNRSGEEKALVVYHNRYAETSGWIRTSTAFAVKDGPGGDRSLVQKSLGEGLGLKNESGTFTIFREHNSGLEFIRSNRELVKQGLFVTLSAYKSQVFIDFREVIDDERHQYAHLTAYLDGRGVPSIEEAAREIFLRPVHEPIRALLNPGMFRWIIANRIETPNESPNPDMLQEIEAKAQALYHEVLDFSEREGDPEALAREIRTELRVSLQIIAGALNESTGDQPGEPLRFDQDPVRWGLLLGWIFTHALGKSHVGSQHASLSRSLIDEWLLGKILARTLQDIGVPGEQAWRRVNLIKLLTTHQDWYKIPEPGKRRGFAVLESLLSDSEAQHYLGVNRYQSVLWLGKEPLEELLAWLYLVAAISIQATAGQPDGGGTTDLATAREILVRLRRAAEDSGYRLDRMEEILKN